MKWKMPHRKGKYKLIATEKLANDIGLIVLCPEPRNYKWRYVKSMPDSEIKDYFMSMQDDIEVGAFDVELLHQARLEAEEQSAAEARE
ncbi:hypothetical protein [Lentibacillus salicampi]|uniref:Uncharacterized protein n=1 Tax=Lentibacillus salicampi TaxID=175306 RepID=A0A4Y9AB23_9BACI|nr:hypothetical protein [Lentibacillus salicampi]TFJ92120.1 hypothetical protein E4U82_14155 [Lentibacillus salicampi]